MPKSAPFIWINGIKLPCPARGLTVERQQLVDSARNAKGEVVAQKIGRRQIKLSNLVWKHLTADEWHTILTQIELFQGTLTFYDAYEGKKVTRKVYWGDASEEPLWINDSGDVTDYINCKCNLIDMGYA